MTDLFVSYARNDEQTAVRVAQCLGDAGYQVWSPARTSISLTATRRSRVTM